MPPGSRSTTTRWRGSSGRWRRVGRRRKGRWGLRLYRAEEMRRADALAAARDGGSWPLMAAAGAAVAREVLRRYPGSAAATVLCGKGNNGGDGYVCAARLFERGVAVTVLEVAPVPGTADARRARAELLAAGVAPGPLKGARPASLGAADVIVDALLGSGLTRPVAGPLGELLAGLHLHGAPVVAVDVPSGVGTDAPRFVGPHVTASVTVELAGRKPAGAFHPTRGAYGEQVLADIGMPADVLAACGEIVLLGAADAAAWLPRRSPDANKYSVGTVTVVGGSAAYAGAAELACRGAWRAGAGLVTLVGPARHPAAWPETIFVELAPLGGTAALTPGQTATMVTDLAAAWVAKRAAATVIGPGLDERLLPLLPELLRLAPGPAVLDAAALRPAAWPEPARAALRERGRAVMTPHAGEAAALLDRPVSEVVGDPLAAAGRLAEAFGATVVLKGPTTVVRAPGGAVAVSERGHPAMATGGTGDVLAGVVGALVAAPGGDDDPFSRTCAAVWLHGVAGELAAASSGAGLTAGDLAEALPRAAALAGVAETN